MDGCVIGSRRARRRGNCSWRRALPEPARGLPGGRGQERVQPARPLGQGSSVRHVALRDDRETVEDLIVHPQEVKRVPGIGPATGGNRPGHEGLVDGVDFSLGRVEVDEAIGVDFAFVPSAVFARRPGEARVTVLHAGDAGGDQGDQGNPTGVLHDVGH